MPNTTLIVSSTVNRPLLRTACFLDASRVSTAGTIVNSSLWLRGPKDGWRTEWLLSGLDPRTNYTAFVVQDAHKVSGPIFFITKSASFMCTLAHALPFCPSTAYSVPLPPPPLSSTNNFPIYDATNVPQDLFNQTIGTLTNFTISLSTFACGSDMYSPLVGCDDCQREYRRWLCAILFPRCSEPSPENLAFITPNPKSMGIVNAGPGPAQAVLSALLPVPSQPATTDDSSPYIQGQHIRLLPCIELCTAVDRACPPFLQFRCPKSNFNGAATYGFGYIDGADGTQDGGLVTSAQDQWGNVWCNAGWVVIADNECALWSWKDGKSILRNENCYSAWRIYSLHPARKSTSLFNRLTHDNTHFLQSQISHHHRSRVGYTILHLLGWLASVKISLLLFDEGWTKEDNEFWIAERFYFDDDIAKSILD